MELTLYHFDTYRWDRETAISHLNDYNLVNAFPDWKASLPENVVFSNRHMIYKSANVSASVVRIAIDLCKDILEEGAKPITITI